MRNSDLLVRIAAGIDIVSALWNLLMAFVWFISLVWICVGVFWGLVALFVIGEIVVAVFALVKGYTPFAVAGPAIGLVASVCNLNVLSGGLTLVSLVLMIVGIVMRGQENEQAAASG